MSKIDKNAKNIIKLWKNKSQLMKKFIFGPTFNIIS